jgi:hypothetical protein
VPVRVPFPCRVTQRVSCLRPITGRDHPPTNLQSDDLVIRGRSQKFVNSHIYPCTKKAAQACTAPRRVRRKTARADATYLRPRGTEIFMHHFGRSPDIASIIHPINEAIGELVLFEKLIMVIARLRYAGSRSQPARRR